MQGISNSHSSTSFARTILSFETASCFNQPIFNYFVLNLARYHLKIICTINKDIERIHGMLLIDGTQTNHFKSWDSSFPKF